INKALETLEDLHDKRFPKPPEVIKPLETRLAEAKVQNGDKNIIVKSPDTGVYEGGWAVTGEVFNTANRQEQMFVVSKDNVTFPIPVQEVQEANKLIRTVNEWVRFGNEVGVAVNSRDPVYIQNQGALDREMAADEACKMFRKGRQNLDRMTQLATVMASLQERQAEIENQ
ncbi:hypothetical protein KAZ57_01490, partial [Patescibacteria group bacterium]|nr:hypothetical protein [Patescibacteria group bacterium]